jgi:hypothetical protein
MRLGAASQSNDAECPGPWRTRMVQTWPSGSTETFSRARSSTPTRLRVHSTPPLGNCGGSIHCFLSGGQYIFTWEREGYLDICSPDACDARLVPVGRHREARIPGAWPLGSGDHYRGRWRVRPEVLVLCSLLFQFGVYDEQSQAGKNAAVQRPGPISTASKPLTAPNSSSPDDEHGRRHSADAVHHGQPSDDQVQI